MSTNTTTPVPASPAPLPPADGQTPAVKPGHRLVPALIGTFHRRQVAWIACPTWCQEDHMAEPSALEDVTHYGEEKDVEVASLCDPDTLRFHWTARIMADPTSAFSELRAAHISLDDESAEDARMTPEMAETLADDLVGFAAHLRQLARTVRTINQAAGGMTSWTSLTRLDLQTQPVADLIRAFGVTVQEDAGIGDKFSVVLGGEPGSMLLLVHPMAPQHVREYETRKALVAWREAQGATSAADVGREARIEEWTEQTLGALRVAKPEATS